MKAVKEAAPPTNDDAVSWTIDALDKFAANHFAFIKIDASCWNVRLQGKLAQHRFIRSVRELVAQLHIAHDEGTTYTDSATTIFPELSPSTDHLDNLTFLIGLSRPLHSSQSAVDKIIAKAQAICQTILEQENLGDDTSVHYEIVDEPMLREALGDMRAIATNLPGTVTPDIGPRMRVFNANRSFQLSSASISTTFRSPTRYGRKKSRAMTSLLPVPLKSKNPPSSERRKKCSIACNGIRSMHPTDTRSATRIGLRKN